MKPHSRPISAHRRAATLALVLAGAASACRGEQSPGVELQVERVTQAIVTPNCPYREVVAFDPLRRCDDLPHTGSPVGVWRGAKVIEPVDVGNVRGSYCRYRWDPASPSSTVRPPLAPFESRIAQVDCPLVAANAPVPPRQYPSGAWLPRQQRLHEQTGWVSKLPAGKDHPVTVAVVDSAVHPFNSPLLDNSGHGRTMGRLIDELACPSGPPCAVQITNHLALREVDEATKLDPADGGFLGTRAQLAGAVQQALDGWVAAVAVGRRSRTVINFSLGWVPALDDNPRGSHGRTLPEDLVFQVLTRASCLGALVVAAAGNGAFTSTTGPILPAGWEAEPAPTKTACQRFVDAGWPYLGDLSVPDAYRPLVHAVSALDYRDRPLAIVRPGSIPRLMAHGMSAITSDPLRRPEHTLLLTGTSVSAAVVSGAAAAVWSHTPTLTAHGVANLLFTTGVTIPTTSTQLCLAGGCAKHPARVSLCAAATELGGSRLPCATVGFGAGQSADLPPPPPAQVYGPRQICFEVLGRESCTPLDAPRVATAYAAPEAPWVLPQPVPFCPSCRLTQTTGVVDGVVEIPDYLGVVSADLYTSVAGTGPAMFLPINAGFASWLPGYNAAAAPGQAQAGLILFGAVGSFVVWGGAGELEVVP
jgi:hypothetical protein